LKKINEKFIPEDDDDMVKLEIDLKKRALSDSNKEGSLLMKTNTLSCNLVADICQFDGISILACTT
jgi:hypothetical protein